MANNSLKARLEVIGGPKVVATFEAIGEAAERSFDKIDREAMQAAARVKYLQAELAKLRAMAANIRAGIKVDDNLGPTKGQRAALALADDLDAKARAIGVQIGEIGDALRTGRGKAWRALARDLDRDRLASVQAARDIRRELDDIDRDPDRRGILSDDDKRSLRTTADALEAASDAWLLVNRERLDKVEAQEANAERIRANKIKAEGRRREKLAAAAREKSEKAILDEVAAYEKAEADKLAAAQARLDAEERERADFTRKQEAYRRSEYVSWWKGVLDQQEADEKAKADALRRLAQQQRDEEKRKVQAGKAEADRLRRQRDAIRAINREWREVAEAREKGILSATELEERKAREAHRAATGRTAEDVLGVGRTAPTRRFDQLLDQQGLFTEDQQRRLREFDERLRGFDGVFGRVRKAMAEVRTESARMAEATEKAGRSKDKLGKDMDGLLPHLRRFGGGVREVSTNVSRFTTSLRSLEYAVGNAALRTGIVGLVGALVLGVGALAGLAVEGGILAGAGWAAFDGAAVARTAQQMGIATDQFSKMRYAANRAGVGIESVASAYDGLRQKTLALVDGEQDALLEALEKGDNQYGARIKLVDRYTNSIGETRIVARDTAQVFDELFQLFAKIPDGAFKLQVADALGVRELLPIFNAGQSAWESSIKASDRMGTTITDGMAKQFQQTRELIYDSWAAIIGVGYELAMQMAPHIQALATWFVNMLTTYRTEIAAWIVDVYQWIARAFLDFVNLFKRGGDVSTHFEWTRNVYNFLVAVYDATMLVWNAMVTGYQKAKPFLDWLAGKFGMGEEQGLTLLLGFIAANLLGIIGLVSSLASVFTRSVGLISSLVFSVALPAISSILTGLAVIVGWPALLGAGVVLVATYWDDITELFNLAWDQFKQTFPTMAATLEEAFGPAIEVISGLIDALWLVLDPILMIAKGFLGVFNLLTGLDLSGTQFFATMLVILGLLKAVTSAVGLLAGSLVARLAPAILSLAVGPGAALVVLGVALGNLLYQFLEFLGVARMVGDWIDQVFYSGGREKIAADIRRRDEDFMRQREANPGVIPGKVHPYMAQIVDERRTRLLGDGRNVFGGTNAQIPSIDVWGKQAFDAFNARLNSVDFGPEIDRRTLRAVGDPRYAGMTGTPVTLVIDGNRTDLVSYDIAELERIANRSQRASLSRTSSWEAR